MLRSLVGTVAAALMSVGCAGQFEALGTRVDIGSQTHLVLPSPPSHPGGPPLSQLVSGRYQERRQVFQADLDLGPEQVDVALSIPGGPVMARIRWDSDGVRTDGADAVPAAIEGERILADLFLSRWPVEHVQSSLSAGAVVVQDDGRRVVYEGKRTVIVIETHHAGGIESTMVRNYDYGYDLTIKTVEREE